MTTEARVLPLENAFTTLVELARVQSERIDDANERQRQFDAHLNVLGERMTELVIEQTKLAAAQVKTEQALSAPTAKVDKLADIIGEGR
jgi:hypothetical protein